ncbi:hypothetical protein VPHK453_0097 [Vibrio phage K453]
MSCSRCYTLPPVTCNQIRNEAQRIPESVNGS